MAPRVLHLTTPNMTGDDVVRVQRLLLAAGFMPGEVDGEFGPQTGAACQAAKYALGYPQRHIKASAGSTLVGYLDGSKSLPATYKARAALRKRQMEDMYVARRIGAALAEVGTKEHPADSNDGPRIRVYQAVTRAFRAAWCASFTCWVLRSTGYKGVLPPLPAYCPSWMQKAMAGSDGWRLIPERDMQPGDFPLYGWGDSWPKHIGICRTAPDASGSFTAIEGNTAVGNDSNGGEVMVRTRNLADVSHVVRVPR